MPANFIFILLVVHCYYQTAISLAITDIGTDKHALLALKSHLHVDPSQYDVRFLLKNWSDSAPVCDWVGVTCSSRDQRVTSLDISTMGLTATLNDVPELGNLTFLTTLNLSNNSFHGALPPWLGSLPLLETLNLSRNCFSGFIPPSLFNAAKLVFLGLSFNSLQGPIPEEIGNLHNLKILKIRNNDLAGTDFSVLSNLSGMEFLDLKGIGLSGNLPVDMCRHLPRLKKLVLFGNELYGPIPSNISDCSQLQDLDLSENNFVGPIPTEIGKLRMLEKLYLSNNNLTGSVPEELGNLTILRELGVMKNELSGIIPRQLFNISTLQYMNFFMNKLSGVLPTDMCSHLNQLENLYLNNNQIFGSLPTRFDECSALRVIDLSFNNLHGSIPPSIGNSILLETLNLVNNQLKGEIPQEIGNLNKLERLHLGGNSLSGPIPRTLLNISSIKVVSLSSNRLSGNLASDLGSKLPNLERLAIADNLLSSGDSSELTFIASLANCRHLRILDMSDNPFDGMLPASIGNLSTNCLQNMLAKNCRLRGSIPAQIGNLSSLTILDLSGNQFAEGSFPKSFGNMRSLQGLDLSGNRVSGPIPSTICELRSLDQLWLSENRISGAIPDCLGNITTLSVLKLGSNELNSRIPTSLWNLRDLNELNLSSNSLVGSLEPQMNNMRAVTKIDISLNQLSGVIPDDIGRLQTLILLRLDHNKLQGSIPESMSNMISLKILDLSYNDLSGAVPKSLQKLQDLISFNVSYNGLEGEIPSDGPFKNFTFESFMFNKGLCGDNPRFRVPKCRKAGKAINNKLRALLISLGTFSVLLGVISTCIIVRRYRSWRDQATIPEGIHQVWSRRTKSRLSYYELFEGTNGFNESNLLGSGGFGSVYKATLKNGKVVAVKVFDLHLQGAFRSFEVECEVLRNLRHRNICKVIDCCSNQDFKALVLEYKPNGSLEKWLYSHNCFLDAFQRVEVMIDVACALEYLHEGYSVPVIHCDLKPSNILLDKNMTAQLCDFGVSKLLGDGESVVQTLTLVTLGYVAPEYGTGGFVSVKCDVYSYGIVLMEVFTRRRPNDETAFIGNLSLRSLVKDSTSANEIVDPNLLRSDEGGEYLDCLSSILELGVRCSVESPYERMSIKDVIVALQRIKLQLHTII